MIIKPKIRSFICTTAHPQGCKRQVEKQFIEAKRHGDFKPYKNVLVIGCSTGYGLASRISATVNCHANTLGVMFEKPPTEKKTATAGWYNNASFEQLAKEHGVTTCTLNMDAFSSDAKQQVIEKAKAQFGQFDLVVYSLAAPRRTHSETGESWQSVLKPIGNAYEGITLDTDKMTIKPVSLEPASEQEIADTVKVMGGEDWSDWMSALKEADLLSEQCQTIAYNYIGREITWPIYGQATIGEAKKDLEKTAHRINELLSDINGRAYVGVLKAVVTQSSSAIPIMPLYISLLYQVMKENGCHETTIDQVLRLFGDRLPENGSPNEQEIFLRVDELELADDIQKEVAARWAQVNDENIALIGDISGYRSEFLQLFGFECDGVDYSAPVDPMTGLTINDEIMEVSK